MLFIIFGGRLKGANFGAVGVEHELLLLLLLELSDNFLIPFFNLFNGLVLSFAVETVLRWIAEVAGVDVVDTILVVVLELDNDSPVFPNEGNICNVLC